MKDTYEQAIAQVFKDEGGYSNDKGDRGGPTNWGITIHDARTYWKHDATAQDVKNMPKTVAEDIYRRHYALPLRYNELPAGLDYAVLDYGINSGISRSASVLQSLVGVNQDGLIGPVTLAAVSKVNTNDIIDKLYNERIRFLRSLSIFRIFGRGWMDRCIHGRELAHKLTQTKKETTTNMTTATNSNIVIEDVQTVLSVLNTVLPNILSVVGTFWAPAAAIAKFLPLIGTLMTGVNVVATATGTTPAAAVSLVEEHLTPGMPNVPALS